MTAGIRLVASNPDLVKCARCHEEKIAGDFSPNQLKRGRACRVCMYAASRSWRQGPGRERTIVGQRRWHMKSKYGLSVTQYEQMLIAQNGVCAICHRKESAAEKGRVKRLSIDHDHETGRIRGLLCADCNTSLGKMGDDPLRLRAAADYLERA